jgi:hypothetical protein
MPRVFERPDTPLILKAPQTLAIQDRDVYAFDANQVPLLEKLERLIDSWARQADEIADFFL